MKLSIEKRSPRVISTGKTPGRRYQAELELRGLKPLLQQMKNGVPDAEFDGMTVRINCDIVLLPNLDPSSSVIGFSLDKIECRPRRTLPSAF